MKLPNHKSHKKKLIPNFLDFVGGHFPGIDWQGQKVPELIWISFVIDKLKVTNAVDLIVSYHEVGSEQFKLQSSNDIKLPDVY